MVNQWDDHEVVNNRYPVERRCSCAPAANTSPAEGRFFGEVGIDAETEDLTESLMDSDCGMLFAEAIEPAAKTTCPPRHPEAGIASRVFVFAFAVELGPRGSGFHP
jgi:hypothetical protein